MVWGLWEEGQESALFEAPAGVGVRASLQVQNVHAQGQVTGILGFYMKKLECCRDGEDVKHLQGYVAAEQGRSQQCLNVGPRCQKGAGRHLSPSMDLAQSTLLSRQDALLTWLLMEIQKRRFHLVQLCAGTLGCCPCPRGIASKATWPHPSHASPNHNHPLEVVSFQFSDTYHFSLLLPPHPLILPTAQAYFNVGEWDHFSAIRKFPV